MINIKIFFDESNVISILLNGIGMYYFIICLLIFIILSDDSIYNIVFLLFILSY